jgi:hypothetical protein
MGRRLRNRPRTDEERAWHQIESFSAEGSAFPSKPIILRWVILALLGRIAGKNIKEARFLFKHISFLSGYEHLLCQVLMDREPSEVPASYNQIFNVLIKTIATCKVPQVDHDWHTLSDQRKILIELYQEYPIGKSHSGRQYQNWLAKHSEEAYSRLSACRCLCQYRKSFAEIEREELLDRKCRGAAEFTYLLLAHMHQTTPSAIRKKLSHAIRP